MTSPAPSNPGREFLPPRFIVRFAWRAHRALYRWSGGRLGLRATEADQEGLAQLVTTGRTSGLERPVMIAYCQDGDDFVTIAMNGWDVAQPQWWLNLLANPNARLTTPDGTFEVVCRAATGADHDRLWNRWRQLDKWVDRMAHRRTDGTAVVVMSPTGGPLS